MSVLTWVKRGEVITVVNEIANVSEATMVVSPCELRTKGYYCTTCAKNLANTGNLVMHLEAAGGHHVAVWCSTHRLYEAPGAEQVEAFASIHPTLEPTR